MKKLLFKITGIITWGQSKLVTTINGAFGCFYGVLQTLEGVGLHSLVLGLAHCTPSNVDALVTFDNLPEKKRMDLVRLWSDHYVARPPRRAVPRKIRFTLRLCPLNTEIFSKRRKIYSICLEDLRWWWTGALPPPQSLLPGSTRLESGEWADPGGTAMPGRLVTRPEQAPEPHPLTKISLISKGTHGPRIRY